MGANAVLWTMAAVAAAGAGSSIAQSANKPDMPAAPPLPNESDQTTENKAQKEKERRRRMYAGIGRSSTILTGPGGLGSAPADSNNAPPKQLLGV